MDSTPYHANHKMGDMSSNRAERTLIGVVLATTCPASLFIFGWWIAAAFSLYHMLPIPVSGVIAAAFTGLATGVVLDLLYLKRWMAKFYAINTRFLIAIYLFWSAVAVALFMGLPLGNILWGMCAGFYVGRRQRQTEAPPEKFTGAARNVGLFTAGVTSIEALFIGLLALREEMVGKLLRSAFRLNQSTLSNSIGIALIIMLSIILLGVQFWCTRAAARFAYKAGKHNLRS